MERINNGTIYNINSIKLWVETFGKISDKNIILIPGAMAPAVFWPTSFCEQLVNMGFFVIRFDNRDMGYSTHFEPCRPDTNIESTYSINDMADDVNGILNQFNIKKAFIAGHSLGGSIAQIFAINHPQKVEQLYLLSSPILATGENIYTKTDEKIMNEMWQVLMSNKLYPDYERGKGEFFRAWEYLNGKYPIDMEMAEEYTRKIYETETIEPAWNHTKVQENIPDIYNKLNNLKCPKHFIYGELDYLASNINNTKTLVKSLNNADLEIIPNGGHMYFNNKIWEIIIKNIKSNI